MGVAMRFGGVGGEVSQRFSLLWTNPSPTSNFAAQTVPLDLAGYDLVYISFNYNTSDQTGARECLLGIDERKVRVQVIGAMQQTGAAGLRERRVKATTTGVVFESAYSKAANSTAAATESNNILIPAYIKGIKL